MTADSTSEVQVRMRRLAANELLRATRRYLTLIDDYREWAAENGPEGPSAGRTIPLWSELHDAEATAQHAGTQRLRARLFVLTGKVYRYEQSNETNREKRLAELAEAQAAYRTMADKDAQAIKDGTA